MGGNALKTTTCRIESINEFEKLVKDIIGILRIELAWDATVIPWYRTKSSFGDVDIIVNSSTAGSNWIDIIKKRFQPRECVRNGPVFSFEYKDFQVDLIQSPAEEFNFALNYFAWNDLGNFIGRTSHRLGFKFGRDGLWYVLRDPDDHTRVIQQILVTRDFFSALEFLGFDRKRFQMGFDTPGEIYSYAMSSDYFDPRQFLLSNRSYASRVRDAKRKMYNGMLKYIHAQFPDLNDSCEPIEVNRQMHLQRALRLFGEFHEKYKHANHNFEEGKKFKNVFNGDVVGEVLQVEGKELGVKMQHLNCVINKYNLRSFIADMSHEQIAQFIVFMNTHFD